MSSPTWTTTPDLIRADWELHTLRGARIPYADWRRGARPAGYRPATLQKARAAARSDWRRQAARIDAEVARIQAAGRIEARERTDRAKRARKVDTKLKKASCQLRKATSDLRAARVAAEVTATVTDAVVRKAARTDPASRIVAAGRTPEQRRDLADMVTARRALAHAETPLAKQVAGEQATLAALRALHAGMPTSVIARPRA